uniref:BACK domain-containing protein n=1 Tax=Glossina pallidipes TaxID=7398 RepID=A0A1A9ZCE9_GLOPL
MEDLLLLSFEEILELIKDDQLSVKFEENAYTAIMKWIKANYRGTKGSSPRLMGPTSQAECLFENSQPRNRNGKFYILLAGGMDTASQKALCTSKVYDVTNSTIVSISDMGSPRSGHSVISLNGFSYSVLEMMALLLVLVLIGEMDDIRFGNLSTQSVAEIGKACGNGGTLVSLAGWQRKGLIFDYLSPRNRIQYHLITCKCDINKYILLSDDGRCLNHISHLSNEKTFIMLAIRSAVRLQICQLPDYVATFSPIQWCCHNSALEPSRALEFFEDYEDG